VPLPAEGGHVVGEEAATGEHRREVSTSQRDGGASSVEYALLVMFVAVVIIGAVALFGGAVGGLFEAGTEPFP
jgi:Flp pilus assembly pilin Flp